MILYLFMKIFWLVDTELLCMLQKAATSFTPSAPPYVAPVPQVSPYSIPPPVSTAPYAPPATFLTASSPYPSYPPNSAYPPSAYPPPQSTAYPPPPYQPPYSAYPPPPYPPPPQASPYYPPGNFILSAYFFLLNANIHLSINVKTLAFISGPFPGLYPPPPYWGLNVEMKKQDPKINCCP